MSAAPSEDAPSRPALVAAWSGQVVVAVILVQKLYFKFTDAPETAYTFEGRGGRPAASRGPIVPTLLGARSPWAAVFADERAFALGEIARFRLVALDRDGVVDSYLAGREAVTGSQPLGGRPARFTSYGPGDDRVAGVRGELFEQLVAVPCGRWPAAQDAFHRHRWADRPALSVDTARADARTVSYAVAETDGERVPYQYQGADEPGPGAECELPLRAEARS